MNFIAIFKSFLLIASNMKEGLRRIRQVVSFRFGDLNHRLLRTTRLQPAPQTIHDMPKRGHNFFLRNTAITEQKPAPRGRTQVISGKRAGQHTLLLQLSAQRSALRHQSNPATTKSDAIRHCCFRLKTPARAPAQSASSAHYAACRKSAASGGYVPRNDLRV